MTTRVNVPILVVTLVVSAALFGVLTWLHVPNPAVAATGFVVAALAALVPATSSLEKANAASVEHEPGSGVHSAGGAAETPIVTDDGGALKLKRDLMVAWAERGETIDTAAELRAELVATDIVARARGWTDAPAVPPAPDTHPEGKKAT